MDEIRGNTVDKDYSKTHLDTNTVINTVMRLLQSKSARVRKRTAKSLSYLSNS